MADKPQLTLDNLKHSESSSKVDKAQFLKLYISSQKEHRKLYISEGQKVRASWDAPPRKDEEEPARSVIDAGFRTPVLKPRVLCNAKARSSLDKTVQLANSSKISPDTVHAKDKRSKTKGSDKSLAYDANKAPLKALGSVIRPRPSQKTLEECIPSAKITIKGKASTRKRNHSSDSERNALLSDRRERRRVKKAIVAPKKHPTDENEDGNTEVTKTPSKGKRKSDKSKGKSKDKNLSGAASLALLHGFSATNVGSSRLTLKPSFGVFNKGRASAKTKTQTKAKQKPSANRWTEDKFLNNIIAKEDEASGDASNSESSDNPSTTTGAPALIIPKKVAKPKGGPASKSKPPIPGTPDSSEDMKQDAADAQKPPRAESVVWDIELDNSTSSSLVKAPALSESRNGTVVADTRTIRWSARVVAHSGASVKDDGSSHPKSIMQKDLQENGIPEKVHDDVNETCAVSCVSLGPSQSASQVIRSSTSGSGSARLPSPVLLYSKYFPPNRPSVASADGQNSWIPRPKSFVSTSRVDGAGCPKRSALGKFDKETPYIQRDSVRLEAVALTDDSIGDLMAELTDDSLGDIMSNADCLEYTDGGYSDTNYEDFPVGADSDIEHNDPTPYDYGSVSAYDHGPPFHPPPSAYDRSDAADMIEFIASPGSSVGYSMDVDVRMDHDTTYLPANDGADADAGQEAMDDIDGAYVWDDDFMTYNARSFPIGDMDMIPSLTTSFETEAEEDGPEDAHETSASGLQSFSQGRTLLRYASQEWCAAGLPGSAINQDEFPTVSKVEENVAKQLRGHWRPQKL